MTTATETRTAWDALILDWADRRVKYAFQGDDPATGLDCFRGVLRLLYREAGIDLPDYVKPAQDERGQGSLGFGGADLYRGLFAQIDRDDCRIGDVMLFVSARFTHVAVCLDHSRAVHITRAGIIFPWIDEIDTRHLVRYYRYTGEGHERFGDD